MHLGGEWIRKAELQVDARAQRLVEQCCSPWPRNSRKHDQIHPPHRVVHDPVDTAAGRDDRAIAGDLVAAHHHEAVLVAVVPPAAVAAQELALLGAVRAGEKRVEARGLDAGRRHDRARGHLTGRALTPARRAVTRGPRLDTVPGLWVQPSRWRSAANGRQEATQESRGDGDERPGLQRLPGQKRRALPEDSRRCTSRLERPSRT